MAKTYKEKQAENERLKKAMSGFKGRKRFKYTPGAAAAPGKVKKKKKKSQTKKKKTTITGTAYSRNADEVLRRIKAGR
jgi:hypothetical protein